MAMVGFKKWMLAFIYPKYSGESAFHSGLMLLPGALVMGGDDAITGAILISMGQSV